MRRGTFVAIRHRADGSLYFHKKTPFWSALRESVAIVLFIVIALVLLELAIIKSSATPALCKRRYGLVVIVDHWNTISTRYGHLSLIETTVGKQKGIIRGGRHHDLEADKTSG